LLVRISSPPSLSLFPSPIISLPVCVPGLGDLYRHNKGWAVTLMIGLEFLQSHVKYVNNGDHSSEANQILFQLTYRYPTTTVQETFDLWICDTGRMSMKIRKHSSLPPQRFAGDQQRQFPQSLMTDTHTGVSDKTTPRTGLTTIHSSIPSIHPSIHNHVQGLAKRKLPFQARAKHHRKFGG